MSSGKLLPGTFLSNAAKLSKGIWPWTEGVRARLPVHYKLRYIDKFMTTPQPVHYKPDTAKWKLDAWGTRTRVQNVPIPTIFPDEANQGLWGGEGIIQGYKKKKDNPMKPRVPFIWRPRLLRRTFYSEVLDKWMEIVVTKRTLRLVDDAYGFDFYILKSHEIDLQSKLGSKLKREMLLALATKSLWPDNPKKRDEIWEKFKEFIISEEEIPWVGLSLNQAEKLQFQREENERLEETKPLKEVYIKELIDQINTNSLQDATEKSSASTSWSSKLNPFKDK